MSALLWKKLTLALPHSNSGRSSQCCPGQCGDSWPGQLRRRFLVAALLGLLVLGRLSQPALGQTAPVDDPPEKPDYGFLGAGTMLVPQTLLGLIHAREVQQELGLPQPLAEEFWRKLQEIDGPWWRSRNLPEAERRQVVARQEELLLQLLETCCERSQLDRLRQLELQAQGARMLLRPEVADFLQLSPNQRADTAALFAETERLLRDVNRPESRGDEAKQKQALEAKQGEAAAALKLLTPDQQRRLPGLLGPRFDTTKLSRIYPLAPELIDTAVWVGDRRVKLADLRGQVVLLHFYAFQCHNCQANFGHYNRWQEQLARRGVEIVGIQTPELEDERDPQQVVAAAQERGFQFPVLIDLDKANWDAWGNTMWPTVYVIDPEGYIRMWWQGELNWQGANGEKAIEELVEKLLPK